jgi:hypothetical protein
MEAARPILEHLGSMIVALVQMRHNLFDIDTSARSHGCIQKRPGLDRRNLVGIV